jgi:hypothetical protein
LGTTLSVLSHSSHSSWAHLKSEKQRAFINQPVGRVHMDYLCSVFKMNTDNKRVLEGTPRAQLLPASAQRICIQANLVNNNLFNGPNAANVTAFQLEGHHS